MWIIEGVVANKSALSFLQLSYWVCLPRSLALGAAMSSAATRQRRGLSKTNGVVPDAQGRQAT